MTPFKCTFKRLFIGGTRGGVKQVSLSRIKYNNWCLKPSTQSLLNDIHHPLVVEYFLRLHMKNMTIEKLQADNKPFPVNLVDGSPFDFIQWNKTYRDELETAETLSKAVLELEESNQFKESLLKKESLDESDKELLEMTKEDINERLEAIRSLDTEVDRIMELRLSSEDIVGSSSNIWNCTVTGRAGGEEASIFAGELTEMFKNYARDIRNFSIKVESEEDENAEFNLGDYKFQLVGPNVYRYFHHEIGVHKVQRVPVTESSGKMQTSTATFTMVPVLDPVSVNVLESDCTINYVRGSGPGGQGMQSSSNCCVLTHKPSGISVKCHQSRSALGNKDLALQMVAQQILARRVKDQKASLYDAFNNQWSSGERSDKMRTYNFPQNRVTDHRLGKDYPLSNFMEGGSGLALVHDELNNLDDIEQLGSVLLKHIEGDFGSKLEKN